MTLFDVLVDEAMRNLPPRLLWLELPGQWGQTPMHFVG